MKKKLLFSGALFCLAFASSAQTWQFTDEPQEGDTGTRYLVDTTSVNYADLSGAGQTWDYSMLGGYVDNTRVLSVTDADLYSDLFPDATHMQLIPGFINIAYNYEANNDKIAHGYEFELPDLGIVQFIFDQKPKMLEFPMSLGTSFEDELSGTLVLFDEDNDAEGTTFVLADGTGTLKLANDVEHTNVLRINTIDTIYADIALAGLPFPTSATIVRHQFDYVKAGESEFPLFTHATLTVINPIIGQIKISVVLSAENPVGFANTDVYAQEELLIYPNPNAGVFALQLPINTEEARLKIMDVAGVVVFDKSNYSDQESIDLTDFPSGLYFATVEQSGFTQTVKLIKK